MKKFTICKLGGKQMFSKECKYTVIDEYKNSMGKTISFVKRETSFPYPSYNILITKSYKPCGEKNTGEIIHIVTEVSKWTEVRSGIETVFNDSKSRNA